MPLIVASFSGLFGYGRIFTSGTIVSTINGSQYLNGETAYMVVDNTNDFRLGTGDFTVEWFQNIQYANTIPRVFSMGLFPSPSFSMSFSTFISSTTDITFPTDPIYVWPSSSSSLTAVSNVLDGLSSTAYQNNTKYGGGYVVVPRAGASIVTQLAFVTAATLPTADPLTFTLEGTNQVVTAANLGTINWTTIVTNQATNCSETRLSRSLSAVFPNTGVYIAYRVRFPTVRDGSVATFVQIGEVEMLGSIVNTAANVWMNSSIVMNVMTSTILYDSWVHFALTRSNNAIRLFQNGIQLGSLTSTISLSDSVNPLLIGTGLENTNYSVPLLTANTPTGSNTILFTGTIANTGGAPVTVRGFVWSLSPNPTIALATRVQETGLFQAGIFSGSASGLLPATQYYVRAFATSYVGTGYSADVVFTTDNSAPVVSTVSAATIVNNSSLIIGQIVLTGGQPVTLRGFAWDTNVDPTVNLSTVYTESGSFGSGLFSTYITGLSSGTNYYTRAFASNVLGISYGLNTIASSGLYDFTTFTFTNAGQQGAQGPTLTSCRSAYAATSWTQNASYFNVNTQGIQEWTVPRTATYQIQIAGAAGGFRTSLSGTARPGYGYRISGRITLTQGQVVKIVVGQRGVGVTDSSVTGNQAGGGGGASCVFVGSTLLMIAAGGNGQSWEQHSVPDPDGRGTGQTVTLTSQGRGYQGATFNANGDGGSAAALAILNGAVGGNANGSYAATGAYSAAGALAFAGGFGGGGGTNPYEGGGGGGYQGGIPKGINDYTGTYLNQGAVSFMDASVTSQTNIGTNSSGSVSDPTSLHGYCTITVL